MCVCVCVHVESSLYHGAQFTCLDGSSTMDFSHVNDDYCDCEGDGSDEPGVYVCCVCLCVCVLGVF